MLLSEMTGDEYSGLSDEDGFTNIDDWSDLEGIDEPARKLIAATDPELAYDYARYVVRGRFKEGEQAILSDASIAVGYARFVIRDHWPEVIDSLSSPRTALHYINHLGDRIPNDDIIKILNAKGRVSSIADLPTDILIGLLSKYSELLKDVRPEDFESKLLNSPDNSAIYALIALDQRWPEAEPAIQQSRFATQYAERFLTPAEAKEFLMEG